MRVRHSLLRAVIVSALAFLFVPSLAAIPAAAKTVTFRHTGAPFPINLPNNWRVKDIERGIEITSNDREVSLFVEAIDTSSVDAVVNGYFNYFRRQGVKMRQPISQKKDVIGGVDVVLMDVPAFHNGATSIIRLMITNPRPQERKGLFIGYWASLKGDRKHDETVTDIIMDLLRP